MELITIVIGGILILFFVALVVGVLLVVRRRAAAQPAEETPKQTPKKPLKKTASQSASKKRDQTNIESASQTVTESKPAQPRPARSRSPSAFNPTNSSSAAPAHPAKPEAAKAPPGEKIRILIVDDNEGTRENVTRLLYFEDDLAVVGQAMNGRQGLEMAIEMKPHIVLMDINMPDMDGITATQEMGLQSPFSQVIIMSVQSDQHYMKRAMAAGARDFQPKPFTSEELVSCIRRVYKIGLPVYQQFEALEQAKATQRTTKAQESRGQDGADAPVIAVYSPKGGVGTSAIAGNLAVALQQEVGDTVLMDSALQFGDVMVHLNTRATRTISDLVHENGLEADLLLDVLLPHNSGLKLLLAPPSPELAEVVTPTAVTEVVKSLKQQFKLVIIDTYSQLTDITLAVLDNADYILLVTTPELPSIKSAKHFLELAEMLEFDPNRLKVVINRANEFGGIPPRKVENVLNLNHTFLIPNDPRLDAALRKGLSVCLQDTGAPAAVAIADMARQVWENLTQAEAFAVEEVA